ncbi:hypothetical protein FSP39_019181 [Pinctada imbricata]|uniref:Uncharacterized protein n=1 Tax=Pinctada imbricata TaxID=66713 RepID=A0AA88YM53_PINIB|nr:hypothetical protein FSP39_019181 [Pinctada imbricata]
MVYIFPISVFLIFHSATTVIAGYDDGLLKERYNLLNKSFDGYDARVAPIPQKGEPVINYVQIYLLSMGSNSDLDTDFTLNFYLRQSWRDSRLTFTSDNVSRLEIDAGSMDRVWTPDTYFINEKRSSIHDVTVLNKLLHIFPNGNVLSSMRISGTFTTAMHLHKFPFDHPTFYLNLTSYGYSEDTVVFRWMPEAVVLSPNLEVAQFDLHNTSVFSCEPTRLVNMKFNCIGLKLSLNRRYGYYLLQVYVPSMLIVFLSWVSLWLSTDSMGPRVLLGVLTITGMTTQFSGTRAALARVSYIKAIDVWMGTCIIYVFLAIVEFAMVDLVLRTGLILTPLCARPKDGYTCAQDSDPEKQDGLVDDRDKEKIAVNPIDGVRDSSKNRITRCGDLHVY